MRETNIESLHQPQRHPLTISAYRHLWVARICATLGQSNLVVALGWAVYDIARGSMDMRAASLRIGLVGFVQFVPVLLLNPLAGKAADQFDRRLVVRCSLLGQLASVGLLIALIAAGHAGLAAFYLSAACFAAARAFYMPAMNALTPALVPAEVLPRAIALSAIAGRVGGVLGPVLGGIAYGVGPLLSYGLTLALLSVSLVAHLGIRRPAAPVGLAGGPRPKIRDGFAYVATHRLLLGAISLDLFAVLFGGATAMLPALARDVLHIGPSGLGLLRAASSVGAVTTATWLSARPLTRNVGPRMLWAVVVYGFATIGLGLSNAFLLSLAMLALAGAADMVSVYVRQTLVQVATPDAMRGRVSATSSLFVTTSNELGEMESGLAAAVLGPAGSVIFGGIAAVIIAGGWGAIFPELRRVTHFGDAGPAD